MPAQISIIVSEQRAGGGAIAGVTQDLHTLGAAADSNSGRVGGFFSNMLSTAAGFLAANVFSKIASSFTSFISSGISDAREAAIIMAQTENVISSMGNAAGVGAQHVAEFAASLSDAAGKSLFGDDQIQKATNMLLTFGEIKGEVLDLATTLTVDMAQALDSTPEKMAVMVGKILNSADAMAAAKRMGVSFTDEQIKLGKAMFEAGNKIGRAHV